MMRNGNTYRQCMAALLNVSTRIFTCLLIRHAVGNTIDSVKMIST